MSEKKVSVDDFLNATNQSEKFPQMSAADQAILKETLEYKFAVINETQDYFIANNEYQKAAILDREIIRLKNALAIVKPVIDNTAKAMVDSILAAPDSQRQDMFDKLVEFSKGPNNKSINTSDAFKQKVRDTLLQTVDQLKKDKSLQILPSETTRKQLENAQQTLKIIDEPAPTQRMKPR